MTDYEKQRAKEKAEKLVEKFTFASIYFVDGAAGAKLNAKQCASIAVDEILNNDGFTECDIYLTDFWLQVKKEIEVMQ